MQTDTNQRSAVHVEFYVRAVQNKAKSAEAGHPIFDDAEFVQIKFPGDKNRVLVAPAHEAFTRDPETNQRVTYAMAYPQHYEHFRKGVEFQGEGAPIAELPFLSEAKRAELRALNVHTAEQLAGLDGAFLQKLGMGAREMKNQAAAYLARAKDSALETKMAAELTAANDRIASLQDQMEALMAERTAPAQKTAEPTPTGEIDPALQQMEDADLKAFIKDRSGATPRGNPSRETLLSTAQEIVDADKARDEAAA